MSNLPIPVKDQSSLDLLFVRVFSAISELDAKINAKEGIWFIQEHTHSQDELISDPAFEKIYSLLGNLDDLVERWSEPDRNQELNKIDSAMIQSYYNNRIQVEQRLSDLRKNILLREPTGWEKFVQAISALMRRVMSALPALGDALLAKVGLTRSEAATQLNKKASSATSFLEAYRK